MHSPLANLCTLSESFAGLYIKEQSTAPLIGFGMGSDIIDAIMYNVIGIK